MVGPLAGPFEGLSKLTDRIGGAGQFLFTRAFAPLLLTAEGDGTWTAPEDFVGYVVALGAGGRGSFAQSTNTSAIFYIPGGAGGGCALARIRLKAGSSLPFRIGKGGPGFTTSGPSTVVEGQTVSSGVTGVAGEDTTVTLPSGVTMRAYGGLGAGPVGVSTTPASDYPRLGGVGRSGVGGDLHWRGGSGGNVAQSNSGALVGEAGENGFLGGGEGGRYAGGGGLALPSTIWTDVRLLVSPTPSPASAQNGNGSGGTQNLGCGSGGKVSLGGSSSTAATMNPGGSGGVIIVGALGVFK